MAGKRVKFHEWGAHNDIKYSGPLTFQSFQILGWTCIVVTVIMTLMKIAVKVNPSDTQRFQTISDIISYIAELSLPFLLMANFSRILNNTDGYRKRPDGHVVDRPDPERRPGRIRNHRGRVDHVDHCELLR